jgi:hypothetical protein
MFVRDAYPELVLSSAQDRIRELERDRSARPAGRGRRLGRRNLVRRLVTAGANR